MRNKLFLLIQMNTYVFTTCLMHIHVVRSMHERMRVFPCQARASFVAVEVPPRPGPTDERTERDEPRFGKSRSKGTHFFQSVKSERDISNPREKEMLGDHAVKTYHLNSRRLTAEIVNRIAKGLGLPTNASLSETRQLIEGTLEGDHEPQNVQVDVTEAVRGITMIRPRDEGTFAEFPTGEGTTEEQELCAKTGSSSTSEHEGGYNQ